MVWTSAPSETSLRQSEVGIAVKVELHGEGKTRLGRGYASDTSVAVKSGFGKGLAAWIAAAVSRIIPSDAMGRGSASGIEESKASERGFAAFGSASRE